MLIDTLKFKTRLLEGGFEENEAQALVDAMAEALTEHFATKTDIQEVRTDIEKLRGEIKADIEQLRGQMTNIKWIVPPLLVVNLGILGKLLFT
ncbi:MAG: CCDC90 family protein [Candidatus Tectomicrobia bacterium]|nr:CCDC90 family protein [Candidatus Tectomicrobia bacterium]